MAFGPPIRSLRLWLHTGSLLSVLAGYGILLGVSHGLASYQRQQNHAERIAILRDALLAQGRSPEAMARAIDRLVTPGFSLRLMAPRDTSQTLQSTRLLRQSGHIYLVTVDNLSHTNGQLFAVEFKENVTQSFQDELLISRILIVAAGVSALFTSMLLRSVIRKGLQPVNALGDAMASVTADDFSMRTKMPLSQIPVELEPITASFSTLLSRLSSSWERQRSFVDGVSHELRTPITLVSGYTGRLLRRSANLEPEQRHSLELIQSEAKHMTSLVQDLLDIARDDSGRLELDTSIQRLDLLVTKAYSRLETSSFGRLSLSRELPEAWASFDAERLLQCLTNLVENALKYAPHSTPVELSISGLSAPIPSWIVHVRDHGPGVPDEAKHLIFERFRRGTQTQGVHGSGIGLAVVQTLATRMGASICVKDAHGGGADFQLLFKQVFPSVSGQ